MKLYAQISNIEEWYCCAPPKGRSSQWKDFRSAKEFARKWFVNDKLHVPQALLNLLESHEITKGIELEYGVPEHVTKLDDYRGGGRNHDMLIIGSKDHKRVVITIEAKVDEPFGPTLGEQRKPKERSNRANRANALAARIWKDYDPTSKKYANCRYQLITGLIGTLEEVKYQKADLGIFIIYEIISKTGLERGRVNKDKLDDNNDDYREFMSNLDFDTHYNDESEKELLYSVKLEGKEILIGKTRDIIE